MSPTSPINPELLSLATSAARDGVALLRAVLAKGPFVPRRYGWHEVSYSSSGLPSFSKDEKAAPFDYSYLFGRASNSGIDCRSIGSFVVLVDALMAYRPFIDIELRQFRDDIDEERLLPHIRNYAESIAPHLVELFHEAHPSEAFTDERFLPIYLRWEEELFADRYPVDFVIPLLMVHADFDEWRLAPNVVLRRMDDELQRARAGHLDGSYNVHRWAAAAATHTLVIEGRVLTREQKLKLSGYPWEVEDGDVFPMVLVGRALAALRISTGYTTGYAQVLVHFRYTSPDPPGRQGYTLHGVPVRRYPVSFDHWGWLNHIPMITREQATLAATLLPPLAALPESSTLAIAARRINDCQMRDRLDDAILDAVIAFETLLSDDDHHEMTHKLALRVAALLRLEAKPGKEPAGVFREVKRIYHYRSKLVHGKAQEAVRDVNKYFDGDMNGPLIAALGYLRRVMRLLLERSEFRKPENIDRLLLLGDKGPDDTDE